MSRSPFIVFLLLPPLIAQVDTGVIVGALSDATGAVLPHAAVVIRNVGKPTFQRTSRQVQFAMKFYF